MKIKVLIFCARYIPSYKSGGPVRSIANMVEALSDFYDFSIVTADRDAGDCRPFKKIIINGWQKVGRAKVYYAAGEKLSFRKLSSIVKEDNFDYIYLNSFFNYNFSIKPLLFYSLPYYFSGKFVLATRGEFSEGALSIRCLKKKIYTSLFKRLFSSVKIKWHASSSFESNDISRILNIENESIHIAMNLPTINTNIKEDFVSNYNSSDSNYLNLIYISRITPKKNIKYCFHILKQLKEKINFNIYGPIDDVSYWEQCKLLIIELPSNIKVTYYGSVKHEEVPKLFLSSDLFFLPTLGENYGHVICESLSVGTPVLISNKTPWRNLSKEGLGWEFDLDRGDDFINVIRLLTKKNKLEKSSCRLNIHGVMLERLLNSDDLRNNKNLFSASL